MNPAIALLITLAAATSLFADDAKPLVPTHANVSYGPHAMNVLDFWKAEGDGPRPLLVYIHGGGWTGGDKRHLRLDCGHFLSGERVDSQQLCLLVELAWQISGRMAKNVAVIRCSLELVVIGAQKVIAVRIPEMVK